MTPEAGLIIGFILGLILAALIYLVTHEDCEEPDDDFVTEMEERADRIDALTERIKGNTTKVAAATGDLAGIEVTETTPTERNPTNE